MGKQDRSNRRNNRTYTLRTHRRCWLTSVQMELREGKLSPDNHAFLHGHPTTVPGSWSKGQVACGNHKCAQLVSQNHSPNEISRNECAACRKEREARQLVAMTPTDARFHDAFRHATAIFSTNDITSTNFAPRNGPQHRASQSITPSHAIQPPARCYKKNRTW